METALAQTQASAAADADAATAQRPPPLVLLLVKGLPGSGKTTLARRVGCVFH
jgi:adenylylsulfate kinase-like enzyme